MLYIINIIAEINIVSEPNNIGLQGNGEPNNLMTNSINKSGLPKKNNTSG